MEAETIEKRTTLTTRETDRLNVVEKPVSVGKMPAGANDGIAVALNAGGKFPWPKGATAVRVAIDGKSKVFLKEDVDTLKDAGIPTSVEFGTVPFDAKRQPKRKMFQPLPPATAESAVASKTISASTKETPASSAAKFKPDAALTKSEIDRLCAAEQVIERGQQTFVEVGLALTEIRDGKLYRANHKTFEDYCEVKWGWGRRMAYHYIESAKAVKSLPAKCEPLVHTERAARALAAVPEEQREAVLAKAAQAGSVTAKSIAAAHQPQIEAVTNADDSTPTDVGACKAVAQEVKDKVDQFIIHGDFKQLFKDLRDVNVIAAPLPKDIDAATLQEFAQNAATAMHKDGLAALIVNGHELPRVLAAVTAEGHLQYRGLGSMQVPRFCTKDHERKINVFHTPVVLLQRPGAAPSWIKDLFVAAPGPMSEPVKSVGAWQALWDGVARPKATVAIPWCGGDGAALVAAILSDLQLHASDPDANAVKAARERVSAEITAVVSGKAKLLGVEENYEEIFAA